jgi:membrane-associated phospholipid phosphatase
MSDDGLQSITDHSNTDMQTITHKSRLPWRMALFTTWFALGIACILLDSHIQPWLTNAGHVTWVRRMASVWEQLGSTPGIVLFILSAAVLIRSDKGRTLLHFAVSIGLVGASVQLLKYLIGRVRPTVAGDSTIFAGPLGLLGDGTSHRIDSMPSGHTAAAFAMALALAFRWPKYTWLWIGLAIGVGISRTLVDAHFPSDVILGALLGTVVGLGVSRFTQFQNPESKFNQRTC